MKILPIEELHFSAALGTGNSVSKSFLYILLLVAFVIILIACFNFVNLNIGLSFTRTKEIGICKCWCSSASWLQIPISLVRVNDKPILRLTKLKQAIKIITKAPAIKYTRKICLPNYLFPMPH